MQVQLQPSLATGAQPIVDLTSLTLQARRTSGHDYSSQEATMPKVSVITSVLNGEKYIATAVGSLRKQSILDCEHVIVDGGSTDLTLSILDGLESPYVSEKDTGIYDAFSKGVLRSKGEYIHFLNSDDVYGSDTVLEQCVDKMDREGLDLLYGKVEMIDSVDKVVRTLGREVVYSDLMRRMCVGHSTIIARRSVFERFGLFSVGFRISGDYEWLLRVWPNIKVGFNQVTIVKMRIGGASNGPGKISRCFREHMAASIMHGKPPLLALPRYFIEMLKYKIVFSRFR